MRKFAAIGALLITACCVRPSAPPPEQPVSVAPPAPAPPLPAVVLGPDWRDWPLTPGDWSYARQGANSFASYGRAGALPDLMFRCDPAARRVTLSRSAATPGASLSVQTSTGATSHAAAPGAGTIDAQFAATDPTLDAMAFSRGRFVVSAQGAPNLVVPAWPEVARVIEDCRG